MKILHTSPLRKFQAMSLHHKRLAMLAGLLLLPLAAQAQFTSNNQTITITTPGTTWSSTNYYVGQNPYSSDALAINSGGTLTLASGKYLYLGYDNGNNNNTVTVSGAGSQLNVKNGALTVGNSGSYNTMTVSNGGAVNGGGWGSAIGSQGTANHNQVVVTGSNSTWTMSAGLSFNSGDHNTLSVLAGGAVYNTAGSVLIGNSGGITLGANGIIVSGTGSLFQTDALLQVGSTSANNGYNNYVSIGSGGTVSVRDTANTGAGVDIGPSNGTGNKVQLDGGTLSVASAGSSTPAIHVMNGSLVLNSGTVTTERLVANTSAASVVTFNGGTLTTQGTTVSNASVFTVGNGTSAASLVLDGGTHTFANGLAISNNATLSGTGTITATGNVNYLGSSSTFNGSITGSGNTLTLNNAAAVLTLGGNNSYSGLTTVSAGTLQLGSGGTTGGLSTSSAIVNNGTFTINRNNAVTQGTDFSGAAITGTGAFTQAGAGTTTLTAANTYTGATTVNRGLLTVNGTNTSSAVAVNSTGTLGGSGSVGAVTVASGGTISPGNSPGTLTVASSIWNDGGNYNWQLYNTAGPAGTNYDTISSTGNLNLTSLTTGGFKINLWTIDSLSSTGGYATNFDANGSYSWSLASFGSITGFNAANFTINTAATNGTTGFANSFMAGGFKVTTNGSGQLLLTYQGASPVWTGGSGNLSTIGTTNGSALVFTGSGGNVTNNAQVSSLSSMTFSNTAGATTFSGSALTNGSGGIVNNSAVTQTVSLPLTLGADQSFNAASGNLAISGNVTNNGNTLTLAGASNTTVSGNISGTGGLTKTNAGTATLSGNNTYSGASTVNGGTLAVGSSTALGSGSALTVNNGSTLALGANNASVGAVTLNSGSITGSGTLTGSSYTVSSGTIAPILGGAGITLTKNGAGSVTLTAAETFTGKTTVSAGNLILATGASLASTEINLGTSGQGTLTATGGITIGSGQTLAGYGTVVGNTTIASGGTLAPGNSPGILTFDGNLTLNSGSTSIFEVAGLGGAGAATGFDQALVSGDLTYGGDLKINITGSYNNTTGAFQGDIFKFNFGHNAGNFTTVQYSLNGGQYAALEYYSASNTWQIWTQDFNQEGLNGNNGYIGINLNTGYLTVVPEPATWALLAFSLTTVMVLCRRRSE